MSPEGTVVAEVAVFDYACAMSVVFDGNPLRKTVRGDVATSDLVLVVIVVIVLAGMGFPCSGDRT